MMATSGATSGERAPGTGAASRRAVELASAEMKPMERAVAIMALLRSPEGCPWDREQSFDTIKQHTLEETYEVFDAIERRSWDELKDELGDLLLQVLFYAQMASEAGYFDIEDVAKGLNAKLIRRHPHIFGDVQATDADAVLRNWEQIKRTEKGEAAEGVSLLGDVSRAMPAMLEARKLGSRAARVGFDWPDERGLVEKLREEVAELEAEVAGVAGGQETKDAVEDELGDLLFTAVQMARHSKVDPESALRRANAKFRARFTEMERVAGGAAELRAKSAEELEAMWGEAKRVSGGERSKAEDGRE